MKRGKSKTDTPKKANTKLLVKKGPERAAKKPRKSKAGKDPNTPKREEFQKTFKEKNPNNKSVAMIFTTASTASLDIVRILRMSGYGLLVLGPSLHFWYNFLSKILPKQDIITILKKILIGQTTFGPVMAAVFFSVNTFLQGESGNEIFSSSVTGKFLTILSLHSMVW
ncbi:hypothetical protein ZIOFF_028118 [Zingiber officinale]|uniref:Uncharacterized protein n=1 Tax=Zingiber officinale TaxID=94328 RepID=A0A8J5GME4_ZINOF|nr:hypothetical protein ZIOFF_028118 [Zingiber officinale]